MPSGEKPLEGAAAVARYGERLAAAVEAALAPWVRAAVEARFGGPVPPELEAEVTEAAQRAVADVGSRLRELLALDIDDQWTNPLSIVRTAVGYPNAILAGAGVEPMGRDATEVAMNPEDIYGLAPAAFGDLGADVHEPGLVWGAAKAHLHLQRRRGEDRT